MLWGISMDRSLAGCMLQFIPSEMPTCNVLDKNCAHVQDLNWACPIISKIAIVISKIAILVSAVTVLSVTLMTLHRQRFATFSCNDEADPSSFQLPWSVLKFLFCKRSVYWSKKTNRNALRKRKVLSLQWQK